MSARAPKRDVIAANDNQAFALAGPNPIHPDRMTARERMAELSSILAAGLLRLRAKQADEQSSRVVDVRLYSSTEESVCPVPMTGESQ